MGQKATASATASMRAFGAEIAKEVDILVQTSKEGDANSPSNPREPAAGQQGEARSEIRFASDKDSDDLLSPPSPPAPPAAAAPVAQFSTLPQASSDLLKASSDSTQPVPVAAAAVQVEPVPQDLPAATTTPKEAKKEDFFSDFQLDDLDLLGGSSPTSEVQGGEHNPETANAKPPPPPPAATTPAEPAPT